MTLYLFTNHNYYNRHIKHYDTIEEYLDLFDGEKSIVGVAFNPNDGVSTSQIVNYDSTDENYMSGSSAPSYCIVANENNDIVSRWWVIGSERIRMGQFRLSLMRDLIADYYNTVLSCPSRIARGYINETANPIIYNPEGFSSNQIKQSETLLKDQTGMPWIVGYMATNANSTEDLSIPADDFTVSYENGLENYAYNKYADPETPYYVSAGTKQYRINFYGKNKDTTFNQKRSLMFAWDQAGTAPQALPDSGTYYSSPHILGRDDTDAEIGYNCLTDLSVVEGSTLYRDLVAKSVEGVDWIMDYPTEAYNPEVHDSDDLKVLKKEQGKIIQDGSTYYQININYVKLTSSTAQIDAGTPLGRKLTEIFTKIREGSGLTFSTNTDTIHQPVYELAVECFAYKVSYKLVSVDAFTLSVPQDRLHLNDAPYDMFCIPLGRLKVGNAYTNAEYGWKLANKLISTFQTGSTSNIYDIQLLPYCPIPSNHLSTDWNSDPEFLPGSYENAERACSKLEKTGSTECPSILIWLESSTFQVVLDNPAYAITVPNNTTEFKIANQCDIYRLCSPNYNGQFEFSATKNGGVSYWVADCSYKPFSPYIRVAPAFGALYGGEYGDARGLVCGGDFSISQISDAWTQYEIQNKNYQVMFDRQITKMDDVREIQRKQEVWNAVTGTIQGGATGYAMGSMASGSNPIVGGITAGIGAGVSFAGGLADMRYNQQLYNIDKSYTQDMFQMGLENIQALPYSLTKIGSQTINYKYFPFVEYYTATEKEKENLNFKLKYTSFTVGMIGYVKDYLKSVDEDGIGTFIQATPIRLTDLDSDTRIANAIQAELRQGVYI